MALIASSFTMEVILLIIGIFIYDGGFIRKFSAVGMFIYGLQTAITSQSYVSDLTSTPSNAFLFFTPQVQTDWAYIFAVLTMITFGYTFISIYRITQELSEMAAMKDTVQKRKKRMELIMEELV